jgi:hypothetical protein
MLERYLAADKNNATHPTHQVHILCGDGRLFSAFRQELILKHLIDPPIPRYTSTPQIGHNELKHGNMFLFEAKGADYIKLFETFTLANAREIRDEYKIGTDHALRMPSRELKQWMRSPSGPCTLAFYKENKEHLIFAVTQSTSVYQRHVARLVAQEWHPYLAGKHPTRFNFLYYCREIPIDLGMFIYACRLQLTLLYGPSTCTRSAETNAALDNMTDTGCLEQAGVAAARAGPAGDCL